MKSIAFRELNGARIQRATEQHEVLAVTNDRVLTAVLIPVEQRLVDQLIDQSLSEIVHGIDLGEQAAAVGDVSDLDGLLEGQDAPALPGPARSSRRIVPVSIRGLSAARIQEAASAKETLGITNHRQLVAVLIPVSQRWVEYIVEQNLSRIVKGVSLGELEAGLGDVFDVTEAGVTDRSDLQALHEWNLTPGPIPEVHAVPDEQIAAW